MTSFATTHDVFHEGELSIQQRAGASAQGRNSGRMISNAIIPGAIKFVSRQPFVVIGSVDEQQNLWASIIVGSAGFMTAEPHNLEIDLAKSIRTPGDPLWRNLSPSPRAGILVIDLQSRARLRVNGLVDFATDDRLHIDVEQAFPNCPQYIQRRNYRPTDRDANSHVESLRGTRLNDQQRQWLARVDTLFVASEHPARGVDVSHRGGAPGFVQVVNSTRIRIPDYLGNGMFNTLGNFAVNPYAGLLVPDFENGRTLQLMLLSGV